MLTEYTPDETNHRLDPTEPDRYKYDPAIDIYILNRQTDILGEMRRLQRE